MAVPIQLQQLIDAALESARLQPQHALVPFQRRILYEYLAENSDTAFWSTNSPLPRETVLATYGEVRNPITWRQRVYLDLLTAQRMLRLWQELRPHDHLAQRMYTLAEDVALGRVHRDAAAEEIDPVFSRVENADYSFRPPYYAVNAIIKAVVTASGINVWDATIIGPDDDDAVLDQWSLDAAGYACDATAGPVWDPKSDATKRLEFWTWWLTEAIPTVWQREEEETPLVPEE